MMQLDQKAAQMPRRSSDTTPALDAFIAAKAEIDALLARLATASADHFEANPEEVHWGHVGNLQEYRDRLREIAAMAFGEAGRGS